MKYLISFLKSPLGFVFNFLATLSVYLIYVPKTVDKLIILGCETFCLKDGIQDDMMF